MPHYTTKPLQVFAIQYTGDNAEEIQGIFKESGYGITTKIIENTFEIYHYIVRDHNGNINVMSAKEFEERYDNDLSQQ